MTYVPSRIPIVSLAFALALILAATPLTTAIHPSATCNPREDFHGYVGGAGSYEGYTSASSGSDENRIGSANVWDPCPSWPSGISSGVGVVTGPIVDGDAEVGNGGGRFPAGSDPHGCLASPAVAHHAYGYGAAYWAADDFGSNVISWAGADGPDFMGTPCVTDGIITSDDITDPLDCGAGETGFFVPGSIWTPATLGENVPGSAACDPWDGIVWVFVMKGYYLDLDTGSAIVSNPLWGHMWS